MTILTPKNKTSSFNLILISLILVLIIIAYWSISAYSQQVDLKHALNNAEQRLRDLELANAEIKDRLYKLTDPSYLIKFAEERGLVKVKSPIYLPLWEANAVSHLSY